MRLGHKDYDLALATVGEIYSWRTVEIFKEAQHSSLRKAIPADYLALLGYEFGPTVKLVQQEESERRTTPEIVAIAERSMSRHPMLKYCLKTGDVSAQLLSDFMKPRDLEADPDFRYLPRNDVNYSLIAPISVGPRRCSAYSFCTKSRDFSERDRTLLNLLLPHIRQARRHAEQASAARTNGCFQLAGEYRHRLAALTPREREVAQWIAQGKTNTEMGLILGASPRTIEKHVHRVLEKLLVENRTAAAVVINNAHWK
jgi:DNA-binding CsgD family transcriptional regulator